MIRRRRARLPPDLLAAEAAFHAVLEVVEPAKAGLADVLPTTRMPGRPFAHALAEFVQRLREAGPAMPPWRHASMETHWVACDAGLRRSLELAERWIREAPEVGGFDGLLGAVTSLLDPLEPFSDAERAFRSAHRRFGRSH